jgi:hypothetical protein
VIDGLPAAQGFAAPAAKTSETEWRSWFLGLPTAKRRGGKQGQRRHPSPRKWQRTETNFYTAPRAEWPDPPVRPLGLPLSFGMRERAGLVLHVRDFARRLFF